MKDSTFVGTAFVLFVLCLLLLIGGCGPTNGGFTDQDTDAAIIEEIADHWTIVFIEPYSEFGGFRIEIENEIIIEWRYYDEIHVVNGEGELYLCDRWTLVETVNMAIERKGY